jgi:type II secretory pathway component PulJ
MTRRAFSLIEMSMAVGMTAFVALVAMALARQVDRIQRDAIRDERRVFDASLAIETLRRDIWRASSVTSADSTTLSIDSGRDGIVWASQPGHLTRSEGATESRFADAPAIQFEVVDGVVMIRLGEGAQPIVQPIAVRAGGRP